MTLNISRLNDAIEARLSSEGLTRRELARRLAVSPSTFTRMARGHRPDVDTFLKLVRWLDQPAEAFAIAPKAVRRARSNGASRLGAIAHELRRDPQLGPKEAAALEQILKLAYHRLKERR